MDFSNLDPVSIALGIGIGITLAYFLVPKGGAVGQINHLVQKDKSKVATICPLKDIEDMCSKSSKKMSVYCRCWKSKNFPYCDGSHVEHNKETGDNIGPLVIKKEE